MHVRQVMTANPVCCTPDMSVERVAALMLSANCGAIPVISTELSRRVVGIVTDRDIACKVVAAHRDPATMKASECMTAPVVTVMPDELLEECCRKMEQFHIHRIPVVNAMGQCQGIVSEGDVALFAPAPLAAEVMQQVSRYNDRRRLVM
jgi:CBS domain-containing protein